MPQPFDASTKYLIEAQPADWLEFLLGSVRGMKEAVTYQAILKEGREEGREEGRAEEARAILLRQGTKRFGPPSDIARAGLEAISSIEQLEGLSERLLDVESWEELLAG